MRNSWAIKNQIKASWEQWKLSKDTVRAMLVTAVFDKPNHTQEKSNRKNTKARVSLCSRQPWTLKEHRMLYEINCISYGSMNTGSKESTEFIWIHKRADYPFEKKCARQECGWKISWTTVSKDIFQFQFPSFGLSDFFYPSAAQQRGSLSLWLVQPFIFSAAPAEQHPFPPLPWLIQHLPPAAPQRFWPALSGSLPWPISEI